MAREFKYHQIQNDLLREIQGGTLHVGDKLPSESQLMERYGASRLTVRNALSALEQGGYIRRLQGKGSFVSYRQFEQPIDEIHSYTHTIERSGMTPRRRVVFSGVVPADGELARALEVQPEAELFCLKRIIFADDRPLSYTEAWLPLATFRGIDRLDFSNISLYEILDKVYGLPVNQNEMSLEACLAGEKVARLLGISPDTPLLFTESVAYSQRRSHTQPVEFCRSWYLTQTIKYTLRKKLGT